MAFVLRGPAGDVAPVWLEAERRWVVWGHVAYVLELVSEVDAARLANVPAAVFAPIGERLGILNFRNFVGQASVAGIAIEVRSKTLDLYEPMLADVSRAIAQLPFDFNTPTAQPYDEDPLPDLDVLYHRWLHLRGWIEGTAGDDALAGDAGRVLFDPHRRMAAEICRRDVAQARDLTAATFFGLATDPAALTYLPLSSPVRETPLARRLHACVGQAVFPMRVQTRQVVLDFDTPENRFVKHVLRAAVDLNRAFGERVASRLPCVNRDLARDAARYDELLESLLAEPLFQEVGDMAFVPTQSTVLQRREGYRGFLRGYARLQAGARHPIEPNDLRRILEVKDVAKLYEYWAFFQVAEGLCGLLGPAAEAMVLNQTDVGVGLSQRTVLRWAGPSGAVTLAFNESFKGRDAARSYSVTLRPDATLTCGGRRYVFDAKFKLAGLAWEEGEPDVDQARVSQEDVHKMHAYKDAIAGVEAAWVLFPGVPGPETFYAADPEILVGLPGVGAIPLRPLGGQPRTTLECVLGRILRDAAQHQVLAK